MKRIAYCFLCIWACLGRETLPGQVAADRFEHFTEAQGLPHVAVQAIHQDRFGYLWIGTWNGLSRYDGYEFHNYQADPDQAGSLEHSTIYDIAENTEGELWVSTEIGVSRFLRPQDQFEHLGAACQTGELCGHRFADLEVDPAGSLWVSSTLYHRALFKQQVDGRFVPIDSMGGCKLAGNSTRLWLSSPYRLYLMTSDQQSLEPASKTFPALHGLAGKRILDVTEDRIGRLWIATNDGMYLLASQNLIPQPGWPKTGVRDLLIDSQGGIWMATTDGLYHQGSGMSFIQRIQHDPNLEHSLSANEINCLYEDRQGNLWIGTERGGLNKLRINYRSPFRAFNQSAFGKAQNELVVYALLKTKDESEIWIGTNVGLFVFDHTTGTLLHHLEAELASPQIRTLVEDAQGNIWIGFLTHGTQMVTRPEVRVREFPLFPSLPGSIRAGLLDTSGRVWLVGNGLFGIQTGPMNADQFPPFVSFSLPHTDGRTYLWDIAQQDERHFWLAGNEGLFCYDVLADTFTHSVRFPQGESKKNMAVFCVHLDPQGTVWAGLWGGGLAKYEPARGLVTRYGASQGLQANLVYGIEAEDQGQLWLSTNQGLIRFSPESETFVSFNQEDGLIANDFDSGAYFQAEDGELFFGGRNGFVSFYPWQVAGDLVRFPPRVRLTDFQLSGESLESNTPLEALDRLHVSYAAHQTFEFQVSAFDFTRPGKTRYQSRLLGYDENWSSASPLPWLRYTGLAPGSYTLEVKANDANGLFREPSLRLHLEIKPWLIQKTWFQVVSISILLLGLMLVVYLRTRHLNRRERTLLRYRAALAKQEALAAQFDHHFTFNSLNSIQRFILENDQAAAVRYVSRFGKLIRRVMQQARKNFVSLEEELETLQLYLELEQSRARTPFIYQVEVDPGIDLFTTELPAMLLQPFVENAIWHGLMPAERPGELRLTCFRQRTRLLIQITDNGIGRKRASQLKAQSALKHQSRGTQLVQERLETLQALSKYKISVQTVDLYDEQGQASGTRVDISIPD